MGLGADTYTHHLSKQILYRGHSTQRGSLANSWRRKGLGMPGASYPRAYTFNLSETLSTKISTS